VEEGPKHTIHNPGKFPMLKLLAGQNIAAPPQLLTNHIGYKQNQKVRDIRQRDIRTRRQKT
jgi:hypothetical protein